MFSNESSTFKSKEKFSFNFGSPVSLPYLPLTVYPQGFKERTESDSSSSK